MYVFLFRNQSGTWARAYCRQTQVGEEAGRQEGGPGRSHPHDADHLVSDTSVIRNFPKWLLWQIPHTQLKAGTLLSAWLGRRPVQSTHDLPLVSVRGGGIPKQTNHKANAAIIEDKHNACLTRQKPGSSNTSLRML